MYPGKDELINAMNLLAAGQVGDARQALRHIVKRRPGILLAWKTLADIAENPKERSSAIRRATLLAPGDLWVIEAKKHRMPPEDAPHARPPTSGPYAVSMPEPEPDPQPAQTIMANSVRPNEVPPAASSLELTRPMQPAQPPEAPSEPPVVAANEATIERPLTAAERADIYGDEPESAPPTIETPRPTSWPMPADATIATPPAEPQDTTPSLYGDFEVDVDATIRTSKVKSSHMQRALDQYSEGLAGDAAPGGVPEVTPTEPNITAVGRELDAPDPAADEDFDAEALLGTDAMGAFDANAYDSDATTIATAAVDMEEDAEVGGSLEPWMIALVAGLGIIGCLMLFAAVFTSGVIGGA